MSFTQTQTKAIAQLCEELDARPLLTVYPSVRVEVKRSGEVIERNVHSLVKEMKQRQADAGQERKRTKAASS